MIDQNKYIHFIEMYTKAYPDLTHTDTQTDTNTDMTQDTDMGRKCG